MNQKLDHLSPEVQTLIASLSVFAGGCTFEAAEAVCNPEGAMDLLEGMPSLIDQSLLRKLGEDEPRFEMLETIREYASEQLEIGEQARAVRDRHATYYLELAEEAEPELNGAQQAHWLNRLEAEHENLRTALGWLLADQRAEEALRLAGALSRFWSTHAHSSEGRQWLERALAVAGGGSSAVRARALRGAGVLAADQGDHQQATALCDESLTLFRELGDTSGIATSLVYLGTAAWGQGDYKRATSLHNEGLTLFRALGDTRGVAGSLGSLGIIAENQGEYEQATTLFGESLAVARELGDIGGIAVSLLWLGFVALGQGDYEQATTLYDESLTLFHELGDTGGIAWTLTIRGAVACGQGDYERAIALHNEGLTMFRELGDAGAIAHSLNSLGVVAFAQEDYERATTLCRESLAASRERGDNRHAVDSIEPLGDVAAARHEPERAARLWGAADAWREARRVPLQPVKRQQHERMLQGTRKQVDEATWSAAWEEGRDMTLERAIQYALGESSP